MITDFKKPERSFIKVKVFVNEKRENVKKISEDKLEIRVKEKAENNMANKRVLKIVSEYFNSKDVRIVSGHKKVNKIVSFIENNL